jgi:hypothetical protein
MATFAEVTTALRRFANHTSQANAIRLLERITGTSSLREVPHDKYADVIAAANDEPADKASDDQGEADIIPSRIYTAWNKPKRAPRTGGDQ